MENTITTPKFDTSAEIARKLRTEAAGLAEVVIRWPSDELWIKRARARRITTRVLGRGQQEAEVLPGESDRDVYNATRIEGSPELTAAEATVLMNSVASVRVLEAELGETEAALKLVLMNTIEVIHTLKIPTAQQVKDCTKAMDRFVGMPHGVFQNTVNLAATAQLWDKLAPTVENYADGVVPIIHKDAVVRELFAELEREAAGGQDENF